MARNEEKANAMLNKWLTMKKEMELGPKAKRPFIASDCDNLGDAEHWRRDVIREVTRKVSEIQNAGLGEHRIRDLNDDINKLFRVKHHWEKRILELGGPNYMRRAPALGDAGEEVPGSAGYRYFGAAKDLPGVRELFQKDPSKKRRTRAEVAKHITPDYYGWRDEEDGVLEAAEADAEAAARRGLEAAWAEQQAQHAGARAAAAGAGVGTGKVAVRTPAAAAARATGYRAHIEVPTEEEVQQLLLRKKKEALLARYASAQLQQEQQGVASMLEAQPQGE